MSARTCWAALSGFALIVMLAGCGDTGPPPNEPPAAVGDVADQELFVADVVEVDGLSTYFDDPNGDPMSYGAESADVGVVTAVVERNRVLRLTGIRQGEAEVTVTATDPSGALASQVFGVTVPNRAPEVTTGISRRAIHVGYDIEITLTDHFADPDGDPLTFHAETRDSSLVETAVNGSVLSVSGLSEGLTQVIAIATDEHGDTARYEFRALVVALFRFRDDFDNGLVSWDRSNMEGGTATIVDEDLHLILDNVDYFPEILVSLDGARVVDGWEVETPVSEITNSDEGEDYLCVTLVVRTGHEEFGTLGFELDYATGFTDPEQWEVYWSSYPNGYEYGPIARSNPDEDYPIDWDGETRIVFGLRDNHFFATGTDGDTIFVKDMTGSMPGGVDPPHTAESFGIIFGNCWTTDGEGDGFEFDWFEFRGNPMRDE